MKRLFILTTLLFTLLSSQTAVPTQAQTFSCSNVTQIPQAECEDLVLLYNSTNGAGWYDKTGWLTTNTPCNWWFGVYCSNGHVSRIKPSDIENPNKLFGNDLSGTIPNLNHLPNLTELDLSDNDLTGTIPNLNLPNLTGLYLSDNDLTGTIPNLNLPNLTKFNLSDNDLTGTIPNLNLPNLTVLDLSRNRLSGTVPNLNLPNLTQLNLYGNQLTGAIPNFTNLPNLTQLNLSGNQLTGAIPNFTNLPNLKELYLSYNRLSGTVPNLNWSSFWYLGLGLSNNCGLVAFDAAQTTVLNSKDSKWQVRNTACPLIYLPLIILPPMTTLYIQSDNTSGISLVEIRDPSNNNKLLLQCGPIGNNIPSFLCGSFVTVPSYTMIATTNKCGTKQGTFYDAKPGGTITRRVFCN